MGPKPALGGPAVSRKNVVFRDVMPFSLVERYRQSEGMIYIHLQREDTLLYPAGG
jgi:hypothetical protein